MSKNKLVNLKMDTKVDELLDEIKNDGRVKIDAIADHLKSQGVLVDINIGRIRPKFPFDARAFGVDVKGNEDVSDFVKTHVQNASLSFLPIGSGKYANRLESIEKGARYLTKKYAIALKGRFVPVALYGDFKKEFLEKKREYFELRDEILEDWEDVVGNFKYRLSKAISVMAPNEAEAIKSEILMKIPTKQHFEDSFYMNIELTILPIAENIEMITDEEVLNDLKSEKDGYVMNILYSATGSVLQLAMSKLSTVYSSIEKAGDKALHHKTKVTLRDIGTEIRLRNIMHNEKLEAIASMFDEVGPKLVLSNNHNLALMNLEVIASHIFGYAKEIGTEDLIDTNLFDEELLLDSYKDNAQLIA